MSRLHVWVYSVGLCLLGAALGVAVGLVAVTILR